MSETLQATVVELSHTTIFGYQQISDALEILQFYRQENNLPLRSAETLRLMLTPATEMAATTGISLRDVLIQIDSVIGE